MFDRNQLVTRHRDSPLFLHRNAFTNYVHIIPSQHDGIGQLNSLSEIRQMLIPMQQIVQSSQRVGMEWSIGSEIIFLADCVITDRVTPLGLPLLYLLYSQPHQIWILSILRCFFGETSGDMKKSEVPISALSFLPHKVSFQLKRHRCHLVQKSRCGFEFDKLEIRSSAGWTTRRKP